MLVKPWLSSTVAVWIFVTLFFSDMWSEKLSIMKLGLYAWKKTKQYIIDNGKWSTRKSFGGSGSPQTAKKDFVSSLLKCILWGKKVASNYLEGLF